MQKIIYDRLVLGLNAEFHERLTSIVPLYWLKNEIFIEIYLNEISCIMIFLGFEHRLYL